MQIKTRDQLDLVLSKERKQNHNRLFKDKQREGANWTIEE